MGHEDARERFISVFKNRINNEGELVLQAQAERTQGQNIRLVLAKLKEMVLQVELHPKNA
jgi:hypothetical protein